MYLPDGTLAASVSMLSRGFRVFCEANGLGFAEAWPVASGNAARLLGLPGKGEVRVGADADLTILNPDGSVAGAVAGGRVIFRAF
jgi:N-acetylglucosamine-6-phosphate deacetylase